jgi:hypothetical protein
MVRRCIDRLSRRSGGVSTKAALGAAPEGSIGEFSRRFRADCLVLAMAIPEAAISRVPAMLARFVTSPQIAHPITKLQITVA